MAYPYQQGGGPGGFYGNAPPPMQQQQYGQPQGYGAPRPPHSHHQHGYGAPPPPPPQMGYAPPQQQQMGYGAPPPPPPPPQMQQQGPPVYLGVYIPSPPPNPPSQPPPGYNASLDADRCRKAMRGLGTDEKALIQTIAPLDAFQVDALYNVYKSQTGKDLLHQIEKETSGWFEAALRAKILGPVGYDVWLIHRACQGAGTHEDILTEVLLMRTNEEMQILKAAYKAKYGKDMAKVVDGELSMKTKRMFDMAMNGYRQDENMPVNPSAVQQDVHDLKRAMKNLGTDEITVCGILLSRSTSHLRAIAQSYGSHSNSLSKAIHGDFSGHMRDALMYIAHTVEGPPQLPPGLVRDLNLIEDSMHGAGTKDERLVYRVVRASWNRPRFETLKQEYARAIHQKGLRRRIEGETSGDYERMLVAIVGP